MHRTVPARNGEECTDRVSHGKPRTRAFWLGKSEMAGGFNVGMPLGIASQTPIQNEIPQREKSGFRKSRTFDVAEPFPLGLVQRLIPFWE